MVASTILGQIAFGFEEVTIAGTPVGERGSYVVRDGVPKSLWFDLDEGHAGLLTGVSSDEKGTLVYEIRGSGEHVQLSKFYDADTWVHENPPEGTSSEDSFVGSNEFRGCGRPPYCVGLSDENNRAFREQVDAQAWRALGKPYVNPVLEIASLWLYNDTKVEGTTYVTDNVPDIPDRFRCDGLMEWSYESAQAVVTATSSFVGTRSVDPDWGVYKAVGGRNNGGLAFCTPKDLYSPPNTDSYVQTFLTSAGLPKMKGAAGDPGHVPEPNVNEAAKTYLVSWSEPFDLSGVFHYHQGNPDHNCDDHGCMFIKYQW